LQSCLNELSFIFTYIFNLSLKLHRVPTGWKTAEIIPVPKKPKVSTLNDLRPVALTPIAMKCFEKNIFKHISSCLSPLQDPCQFTYRAKRSVDDAILIFFNNIYKHIDIPKQYCSVLFVDFSSAFNTIQPHVFLPTLHDLKVNRNIIAWILDFLSEREQFVKLANVIQASPSLGQVKIRTHLESSTAFSDKSVSNTGAPQGCVLSPILFTIYTNDCR